MRFRTRIIIGFIAALLPLSSLLGIGLNEIMFDPDGNENTDEFIELYNDTAYPVDLAGWVISDGEGRDTIIALEQGLLALPHQYVLILDMDYLPSGSTTYDGLVPDSALVVTVSGSTIGSGGLSNSTAETISLINPAGDTASSYTYTLGNLSGRSDEKILLSAGNDSTNWANAIVQRGTPGGRNSVTPPDRDLAVRSMLATPSMPRQGEDFSISITVSNRGLFSMSDSLRLSERWPSAEGDSLAEITVWPIDLLAAGDSIEFVQSNLVATSTPRFFRAELVGEDDQLENNSRELAVSPMGLIASVVTDEIMYSPDVGMSEWIELVNVSLSSVALTNWTFGDGTAIADSTRRIVLPNVTLAPDSFLVLAADSSVFFEQFPPSAQVVVWNSTNIALNNNGDSLLLWDQSSALIDRVDYRPSWGGETGKSLERVSSTSQSNDPLNWATSLDSTGGTPGRVNTRALPQSEWSEEILTLQPNPFSPDGDGRDDLLAIRYRLENADSRLDLKVYDVRGREVCRLANNAPAGYVGEMLWDGTDGRGQSLPTGMYIIYLEALGKGGSRIQTARRVVALARPS